MAQQPQASAEAAAPLDASYALPDACFVAVARPAQVLTSPAAITLPTEVIQAALVQQLGIDPLTAEQVLVSAAPPLQGPPGYSLHARFSAPTALKMDKFPIPMTAQQVGGRTVYKSSSPDPLEPILFFPDNRTIVAFDDFSAAKLPVAAGAASGPLLAKLKEAYHGDDFLAMVDLAPLRQFISMGLAQAPVPPEMAEFLQVPNLVRFAELRVNISRPAVTEFILTANNAAAADQIIALVDRAKQLVAKQVAAQADKALASPDPVEQASGRYAQRMTKYWNDQLQLNREGDRFVIFRTDGSDNSKTQLQQVAVIGVLVALLLPAIQAAREAARRTSSMNNTKQILLGMLNYESAQGAFPASAISDVNGKPLLSWRVQLLPYMEQQALYQQFHLDEPWDSPHNKALIPRMPAFFLDPSSGHQQTDGLTNYLGVKGEGRFFDGDRLGRRMQDLTDGTSYTIAVVQADDDRAIEWTRPDDWEIQDATPMAGFGRLHPGIFLAGFADGHVRPVSTNIDVTLLKALLTTAGGETVQPGQLP